MADELTEEEKDAIARHIAEKGVKRVGYLVEAPLWEPQRLAGLKWGKGLDGKLKPPKKVRPLKRVVKSR
jgi:hypothetical protein